MTAYFMRRTPIEQRAGTRAQSAMAHAPWPFSLSARMNTPVKRREQHRDHPGDNERDRHDREQREAYTHRRHSAAKPTGMKPATVTSVPVSIGKAVDV